MTLSRRIPGLTLAAFGVAVLLGGANFVAVRLSNQELAPCWGAGLRFGLAAVLFVMIGFFLRLRWPRGRLLAVTRRLERFTLRALAGSVLALGGIAWMVVGSQGLSAPAGAVLAMLGAALAVGQSIILAKRLWPTW